MNKAYAVAMCYNEEDIIEDFVRHVAGQQFDGLIVLDHFSDDGTAEILEKTRSALYSEGSRNFDFQILYTRERAFNKVGKINGLAALADYRAWRFVRQKYFTWIVPMDCDEFWQTDDGEPLADRLKLSEKSCYYNHMRNYIITPDGYRQWYLKGGDKRSQLRNEKCCAVWSEGWWFTSGFHNILHRSAGTIRVNRAPWMLVKHYPYRSYEQVRKKYLNLREAILMQAKRDPLADRHSVERGGMDEAQFGGWFSSNCYSAVPEEDKGLIKEAENYENHSV